MYITRGLATVTWEHLIYMGNFYMVVVSENVRRDVHIEHLKSKTQNNISAAQSTQRK